MKELNRTDRLTISTSLVAVILVIGLVTLKRPEVPYSRSAEQTLSIISSEDDLTPEELNEIIKQSDDKYFMVDVRNPLDYHKAHIGQSVNIAVQDFLERDNLKTFSKLSKEGVTIVLIGKDQLEADGVWLILKQIGYDNVRVLLGGYDYFAGKSNADDSQGGIPGYIVEKPRFDFKTVMSSFSSQVPSSSAQAPEPVKIIRKEKKSSTEGGC
jgi:rhodanese-related sulfurtransferase